MGSAGKDLSIIAAFLVIIGTYLTTWILIGGTLHYYGIGGFVNIIDIFSTPETYSALIGIPTWFVYVVGILTIWFLLSGLFLLIGAGSRGFAFMGCILPLIISVLILMKDVFPDLFDYLIVYGSTDEIIKGIMPFNFALGGRPESIGTYLLLVGGIFGFLSLFSERD
jgi:hypothetical protein